MKKLFLGAASLMLAAGAPTLAVAEGPLDAENFTANIGFTTNYMFRGETQSDDLPAVQGGFDWGYGGFYVGIWGSNIDFGFDSQIEIDYYGGYAGEIGPFGYDVLLAYYTYPGTDDDGFEFDYFEVIPSISYTFAGALEPSVYAQFGYSPDYFGEEGTGTNVEGGLGLSLPGGLGIDGAVGYQWVDCDNTCGPGSGLEGQEIEWLYYNVGVTASAVGFDFDLRYHEADQEGVQWLANEDFPDDEFVVYSVSRSF